VRTLPSIACLLACLAAHGAAAEKEPSVSATFRALAFAGPITDAAYAVSEDERVPLLISSDMMTAEQRYHGPANLRFTHLAKDLTETPLATVQLPDQARVILLFVPDASGRQTVKVLRDIDGDFPWGTLRFINLTGGRVKVVSGARSVALENGGDRTLRPDARHQQYASTEILTEREDGWSRGYMLRTFQEDDLRAIYFLLPSDPREHAVLLKGIEERKVDEKAAAATKVAPIKLKPRGADAPSSARLNGSARPARQ